MPLGETDFTLPSNVVSLMASNVIVADWSTLTELMSASLTATSTSSVPMSEMVIEEPELPLLDDEAEPLDEAPLPAAVPPDEPDELEVEPALTSDPTEMGRTVTTPSIGAVTTVSWVASTASLYDCCDDV